MTPRRQLLSKGDPQTCECSAKSSSPVSSEIEATPKLNHSCELTSDVMDGHFVPNITMGAPVLACVKKNIPDIFMDCHMMVSNPSQVSHSERSERSRAARRRPSGASTVGRGLSKRSEAGRGTVLE